MTLPWTLRRLLREVLRRAGSLVTLAVAVGLGAGVAGAAVLGLRATRIIEPLLEHNIHVIAYLGDELGPEARERLVGALRQIPGVERARMVEPEEALARLRAAVDSLGGAAALSGLEPGFLPRSVEISVAGGSEMPARTAALAKRLQQLPGVAEVDAMSTGLVRLLSWMTLGRRLALAVVALTGLASAFAVALAIVAGRARRRGEAEVLALLGETRSGIGRTARLSGAAAALLGAAVGLGGLLALFPRGLRAIEAALGMGPLGSQPSLARPEIAIVLGAALALGWLAGLLGTPRGGRRAW